MRWRLGSIGCGLAILVALLSAAQAFGQTVYVTNAGASSVSVVDPQTGAKLAPPIPVGESPNAIAISPDGSRAVVTNFFSDDVSIIDTKANRTIGTVPVEYEPSGVAITPNGTAIVTSGSAFDQGVITTIDLATERVVGQPIPYGNRLRGVAITPDGRTAIVGSEQGNILFINLTTDRIVGETYVGRFPQKIAVTPDGRYAAVLLYEAKAVALIDLSTRSVLGPPIPVGGALFGLAISPDGQFAYVGNVQTPSPTVSKIDLAERRVMWTVVVEGQPGDLTLSPDGSVAYIAERNIGRVGMLETTFLQQTGRPVKVGSDAGAIAALPAQPPTASFSVPAGSLGAPTQFTAAQVPSPGAVYEWSFGDGGTATGVTVSHTYTEAGEFPVTLTVSDQGCSTELIFTGQTAYCNGSAVAGKTQTVTVPPAPVATAPPAPTPVAPPPQRAAARIGVRIACPRKAARPLCRFKLLAVVGKSKGAVGESRVAHARVRRGKSKVVRLKPRPRFRTKLAAASRVLIRETRLIGRTRWTDTRRRKVVRHFGKSSSRSTRAGQSP